MADQDLPMDVEPDEKKGSSKMMLIIIIVVVLVLVGAGAAFFLMGGDDEPVTTEEVEEAQQPAIYMPLRPSFVVNFSSGGGKTRFLQVEVTLMGRDESTMASLEDHMPLVKSRLVNVFSTQDFDELRTPEGKESMREMALEDLQATLFEELGDPTLEKILFTSFVLQ